FLEDDRIAHPGHHRIRAIGVRTGRADDRDHDGVRCRRRWRWRDGGGRGVRRAAAAAPEERGRGDGEAGRRGYRGTHGWCLRVESAFFEVSKPDTTRKSFRSM